LNEEDSFHTVCLGVCVCVCVCVCWRASAFFISTVANYAIQHHYHLFVFLRFMDLCWQQLFWIIKYHEASSSTQSKDCRAWLSRVDCLPDSQPASQTDRQTDGQTDSYH